MQHSVSSIPNIDAMARNDSDDLAMRQLKKDVEREVRSRVSGTQVSMNFTYRTILMMFVFTAPLVSSFSWHELKHSKFESRKRMSVDGRVGRVECMSPTETAENKEGFLSLALQLAGLSSLENKKSAASLVGELIEMRKDERHRADLHVEILQKELQMEKKEYHTRLKIMESHYQSQLAPVSQR